MSKTFDGDLLSSVDRIEHDRRTNNEINRFLKIILSLLTVYKPKISQKISSIIETGKTKSNLIKPSFGIHMWGPKCEDKDTNREDDLSRFYSDEAFSTYTHVNNEECSAYDDISKRMQQKAETKDGKKD